MSPALASLLDALESMDAASPPTFPQLLQTLYDLRYTGAVTLHFAGGVAREAVLAQPVAVPLDVPRLTKVG